jgi:hypothetical protein
MSFIDQAIPRVEGMSVTSLQWKDKYPGKREHSIYVAPMMELDDSYKVPISRTRGASTAQV